MYSKVELKGAIFDIQSFSVHDGPGCRTSIFFAGCPLKCDWCANPESWQQKKHLMVAENVCKWEQGCRVCAEVCPTGAITFKDSGELVINRNQCQSCESFACTTICPNNALKQCVKEYTVDEITQILKRDFNNWGSDGGVTFTGGEPLMSAKFLRRVLAYCRQKGIHTAIETSAYAKQSLFLEIFQDIDFAFIDVKNMDRHQHKSGTGVYNDRILENIVALKKSDWPGRLVLRQPVIGGYNDSEENALQTIRFMKENGLIEINLLKFHRMGETKWQQLGKPYAYSDSGDVSTEQLESLQALYLDNNIACYVGDNTPF